jgi:hypothetical protein
LPFFIVIDAHDVVLGRSRISTDPPNEETTLPVVLGVQATAVEASRANRVTNRSMVDAV